MAYGVTDTGFNVKPLQTILDEIETAQRQRIASTVNTTSESPLGQVNGTIGSIASEIWEVAAGDYSAASILTATGQALDRKVALSTLSRAAATPSVVTATVNLDAGATLPLGSEAHPDGNPSAVFSTFADLNNPGPTADDFDIQMVALDYGPTRANAGTLTQILTPVVGWNSVTNAEDAALGSDIESDSALRARYMRSAGGKGLRTIDSVVQAAQSVSDVAQALVFENPLDVNDPVSGAPPHSIEVVILGPTADANDVAQAIWDTKGAGIATFGTDSGTATDSNSNGQTVHFNHVSVMDIHVLYEIKTGAGFSAATGIDGIKQAVADWGDANLGIGDDVIISQLSCPVFDFGGVKDIVNVYVSFDSLGTPGTPSAWVQVNLSINTKELADLDTGRVGVVIV